MSLRAVLGMIATLLRQATRTMPGLSMKSLERGKMSICPQLTTTPFTLCTKTRLSSECLCKLPLGSNFGRGCCLSN
eukprot:5496901-Amphidinium_carterae.1